MQQTINLIEEALGNLKQTVRKLRAEQDKICEAMNDNWSNRICAERQIGQLEGELKTIYEQESNKKVDRDDRLVNAVKSMVTERSDKMPADKLQSSIFNHQPSY